MGCRRGEALAVTLYWSDAGCGHRGHRAVADTGASVGRRLPCGLRATARYTASAGDMSRVASPVGLPLIVEHAALNVHIDVLALLESYAPDGNIASDSASLKRAIRVEFRHHRPCAG